MTFKEWNEKLCANFENKFWVNTTPVPENEPKPDLINKRGIYKDSHNASQPWADFQLRPNFPIAMVVVSEPFIAFMLAACCHVIYITVRH